MIKNKITKVLIAFLTVLLSGFSLHAQELDLSQPIPVGSKIVKGELENGLTYYIKSNAKPAEKVQLRLVVNAGSIQENENQQGLAHFMEHMNFNGLEHFPKNELVNYLRNIGVKFGADLNANTGFDRTYYILPIPTDSPDNLKNGFQIVADWAGGALITEDQVNLERKVIAEEARLRGKTAGTRMMKQFLPAIMNGSRYADRLPIGKDSIIMNADADLIRQFYEDWYRPNNMAVIVVGDITTEKAESMIKKYFGDLENPKEERERIYYTVDPYTQPEAMIVTDPEAMGYGMTLLFPAQKREAMKTLGDYKKHLVRRIFTKTMNDILNELAQTGNPPYASAHASVSGLLGSFTLKNEGFSLSVTPIDDFTESIDSAIAVLLRIKKYGFPENKIENAKKSILASYEKSYNERKKKTSSSLVSEFTRNFMRNEPIPGIVNEYKYAKKMLPEITSEEVSKLASSILSNSENFFALVRGPEDGDIDLPSEEELLKIVQKAFEQEVSKVKEEEAATSLLTATPTAGKIVSTKKDKELGTTTYTLSNGVKVTVKPTDFKDDEIIFTGSKFGGTGLFEVKDKSNARFLTKIIGAMGYGQFTPSDLKNYLSGKTVSLSMNMTDVSNNVSGSSSVQDFETLLKLNYLKLTAPRLDKDLLKGYKTKMMTRLQFLTANPMIAFMDTVIKEMYGNSPMAPIVIPSKKDFEKIDVDRAMEIYKNQFSNAKGFHFFIVGNVDTSKLKPLLNKYVASLPVSGEKPEYKDNGLSMVEGDKTFKFYKGHNNKSMILYSIHGEDVKYSEILALKIDLLGQIMMNQINDTIREAMQVIYSGSARGVLSEFPSSQYNFIMRLPCGPENVDIILEELDKEIKGYLTNGIVEGELHKVKIATLEGHKEKLKKNEYWASELEDIMVWEKNKDFFLHFDQKIKSITDKGLKKVANKFLVGDRFIGISYPEKEDAKKEE